MNTEIILPLLAVFGSLFLAILFLIWFIFGEELEETKRKPQSRWEIKR